MVEHEDLRSALAVLAESAQSGLAASSDAVADAVTLLARKAQLHALYQPQEWPEVAAIFLEVVLTFSLLGNQKQKKNRIALTIPLLEDPNFEFRIRCAAGLLIISIRIRVYNTELSVRLALRAGEAGATAAAASARRGVRPDERLEGGVRVARRTRRHRAAVRRAARTRLPRRHQHIRSVLLCALHTTFSTLQYSTYAHANVVSIPLHSSYTVLLTSRSRAAQR